MNNSRGGGHGKIDWKSRGSSSKKLISSTGGAIFSGKAQSALKLNEIILNLFQSIKIFFQIFRCSSNSRDENDFRPLFENFLHDLFVTANLPEWPAAEVLLTHLGRLFAVTFSNPKLDMTLRSTSLDYLAQIATHLRKTHMKIEDLEEKENLKSIIAKVCFFFFF